LTTSIQISSNINLYIIISFFIIVYLFWLYKFLNNSKISKLNKYLIIIFRTMAFLILIIFLINLRINFRQVIMKKPNVVFVWDDSKSMEGIAKRSRYTENILNSKFYEHLNNRANIKHYYGHDELTKSSYREVSKLEFNGDHTNISNMLSLVIEKYSEKDLNSIFLVSDGQSHYGKLIEKFSTQGKAKIYSIGIGKTEISDKIKLVNMGKPSVIKEDERPLIKLNLRNNGKSEINGVIKYRINDNKTQNFSKVNILQERNAFIENRFPTLKKGEYNIKWYFTPEMNDTLILIDNKCNISVVKSKYDIVFCYEIPSPEIKFMKLALSKNLDYNLYNYGDWISENVNQYPDLIICFPDMKNDQSFNWLRNSDIPKILFVKNNFQNYKKFDKISSPKYVGNYSINENFSFLLTEPSITKSFINWKKLPPVIWSGYKITGEIILSDRDTKIPLMSWEEKGNTIYLSITKLWRWKLASYNKEWSGHYSKLINGMAKWLINQNQRKIIDINKNIFKIDKYENVDIPIKLNLTQNNKKDSLKVICIIYDENDSELSRKYLIPNNEEINFNYKSKMEGNFTLISKLVVNEVSLGSDTARIKVSKNNEEVKYIGCDDIALKQLSSNNNGLFVKLSEVDSLEKNVHLEKQRLFNEYNFISRTNLILLILLFIVSIVEWIIRKQIGYL